MSEDLTYENHFITQDRDKDGNDVTFNLVEGKDGGVYWGYGHIDPEIFITELNRWLTHCGMDDEDLACPCTKVEHLWASADDEMSDFKLVDSEDAGAFPVTRVWL